MDLVNQTDMFQIKSIPKTQKRGSAFKGRHVAQKTNERFYPKHQNRKMRKYMYKFMLTGLLHRVENTFTENFTKYIVKHCRNQKHVIIYLQERSAAKPSCRKSKLKTNK